MVGLLMAFVVQSDEARKLYWVLTLCQLAGKELNRALKSIFKQQRYERAHMAKSACVQQTEPGAPTIFTGLQNRERRPTVQVIFPFTRAGTCTPHTLCARFAGMPSYHSQHAFFFVSFLVIFHDRILKGSFDRSTTAAVGYSVASFVSYSRLALQVHSVAQVAVGALVGLFQSAVAWALVRALDAL